MWNPPTSVLLALPGRQIFVFPTLLGRSVYIELIKGVRENAISDSAIIFLKRSIKKVHRGQNKWSWPNYGAKNIYTYVDVKRCAVADSLYLGLTEEVLSPGVFKDWTVNVPNFSPESGERDALLLLNQKTVLRKNNPKKLDNWKSLPYRPRKIKVKPRNHVLCCSSNDSILQAFRDLLPGTFQIRTDGFHTDTRIYWVSPVFTSRTFTFLPYHVSMWLYCYKWISLVKMAYPLVLLRKKRDTVRVHSAIQALLQTASATETPSSWKSNQLNIHTTKTDWKLMRKMNK